MGEYSEARALQEDVLPKWRHVLGPNHPSTLQAVGNLANTLWSMGDYSEARALQEDVLTRSRQVLGPDHPNTIAAAKNLAKWESTDK